MRKRRNEFDEGGASPSIEDCNELVEWIEENNDIDLNHVRFKIRELEDDGRLIVMCEWRYRAKDDPPEARELLVKPGWIIEKWKWYGDNWSTCFWTL